MINDDTAGAVITAVGIGLTEVAGTEAGTDEAEIMTFDVVEITITLLSVAGTNDGEMRTGEFGRTVTDGGITRV